MTEQEKNAQVAAEQKPSEAPAEQAAPALPFDPKTLNPELIQAAEEWGLPVGKIISWANEQAVKTELLEKELALHRQYLEKMDNNLTPLFQALNQAKQDRERQAAAISAGQPPAAANGEGAGVGGIVQRFAANPDVLFKIIDKALGGAPAVDPTSNLLQQYGREYLDLAGFMVKEVFRGVVPEAIKKLEEKNKTVMGVG